LAHAPSRTVNGDFHCFPLRVPTQIPVNLVA
jgi:hypothetical protein